MSLFDNYKNYKKVRDMLIRQIDGNYELENKKTSLDKDSLESLVTEGLNLMYTDQEAAHEMFLTVILSVDDMLKDGITEDNFGIFLTVRSAYVGLLLLNWPDEDYFLSFISINNVIFNAYVDCKDRAMSVTDFVSLVNDTVEFVIEEFDAGKHYSWTSNKHNMILTCLKNIYSLLLDILKDTKDEIVLSKYTIAYAYYLITKQEYDEINMIFTDLLRSLCNVTMYQINENLIRMSLIMCDITIASNKEDTKLAELLEKIKKVLGDMYE